MRDQAVWSIYLGRWLGVQVRVHMFFLLFAVFTLYLSSLEPHVSAEGLGAAALIVLFASVVWHEFGHGVVIRLLGGRPEQVVLGPVGGLVAPRMPQGPVAELLVLVAGPVANALACLLCGVVLTAFYGIDLESWSIASASGVPILESPQALLALTVWVNWFLLLVNLIPAFPFDGGRALRSLLVVCVPSLRTDQAIRTVAVAAKAFAGGLVFVAWLQRHQPPVAGVPVWLGLLLLAIFIFFSARREEVQSIEANWLSDSGTDRHDLPARHEPESVIVGVRRRIEAWKQRRREIETRARNSNHRVGRAAGRRDPRSAPCRRDERIEWRRSGDLEACQRPLPSTSIGRRCLTSKCDMARHAADREDLMRDATALVFRAEWTTPQWPDVIGGLRDSGAASWYFHQDWVWHFDSSSRIRRAFCDGVLYKAEHGALVRLKRECNTKSESVGLLSRSLGVETQAMLLDRLMHDLTTLRHDIASGRAKSLRAVPDRAAVTHLQRWLESETLLPLQIARRPGLQANRPRRPVKGQPRS